MRLAIIHYHLRKGGVTRVISSALEALGDQVEASVVLSSTESEEALPCSVGVIPPLAYDDQATTEKADALYQAVRETARQHLGGDPDVWHIHNHSLGKNACFPEVLRRLIDDGARVLLQIHDFAEDGRPGNYKTRQKPYEDGTFSDADKALYPVAPQIGYAVLNGRDLAILKSAGIPESNLFWLPNAVSIPDFSDEEMKRERHPDEVPLILYPTRAIRRKNVGELLLLAATNPGYRFATTLSPKNPQWTPIHDDWAALAKELNLPVEFALGEQAGHTYASLISEAHAMVSTSVGEGFGLAFLEPWLLGKPVTGRDLPEVTGDFKENGIHLPDLYPEWQIPCSLFDVTGFKERFIQCLNAIYTAYGRSLKSDLLEDVWNELISNDTVDFSCLDETAQAEAIRAVCASNESLVTSPVNMDALDQSVISSNSQRIRENYGLDHYGKSLAEIYQTLGQAKPAKAGSVNADLVLNAFLDPSRLRMLRS
ncbi:glycosyltransferase family 4 protein [Puniceicoccales bacterium CK1056]|uniref:Glycosyltransferase family 4 protein n=1 Tax=Oceanipulchritudo coccoides TaxID=2706888 RepID=A0A6B2M5P5_9BACT|nr:glycosyltransferase family 4 protein [Oceanipulchritudo coccoides]NDV63000.1 glycosyltransferase family 4 protein [Oceanipulchritudo coccoides]